MYDRGLDYWKRIRLDRRLCYYRELSVLSFIFKHRASTIRSMALNRFRYLSNWLRCVRVKVQNLRLRKGKFKEREICYFFCGGIKEVFLMDKYGNRLLPLYIDLNWTGLTWAGKT